MADEPTSVASTDPLTDAYRKARRSLVLTSALLFVWEFGKLELDKAGFLGQSVKIGREGTIPIVLLALAVFFGVRLAIEWRILRESRLEGIVIIDLVLSYCIFVAGVVGYVYQRILPENDLADFLWDVFVIVFTGVVYSFLFSLALSVWRDIDRDWSDYLWIVFVGFCCLLLIPVAFPFLIPIEIMIDLGDWGKLLARFQGFGSQMYVPAVLAIYWTYVSRDLVRASPYEVPFLLLPILHFPYYLTVRVQHYLRKARRN